MFGSSVAFERVSINVMRDCLLIFGSLFRSGAFPFGCSKLYVPKSVLRQHHKNVFISPNGVVFVKKGVRKGILPQMLQEILDTRIMVKNAMKENMTTGAKSKSLQRLLDARQLALKLIANVTYGYTGANFSGRMPCVEIADAIVSKGKETLKRAIDFVEDNKKRFGAKVVYGDTDSLFILFPGCTKEEAFKRGKEIADEVTKSNPHPVKLKFEKVYHPCVLQTKKRYVGYAYEDVNQEKPVFDAKGIETIRRDSCSAASKLLEKSLRILFETKKTEDVKSYVLSQFQKMMSGKVSFLNDFIFAKEYRGRDKYSASARIPSLEIAKQLTAADPRAEPRVGERVPYVIIYGSPDESIYELVRQPIQLIQNPALKLNASYYIERIIIPPLNRFLMLINEDVFRWYLEMPKKVSVGRSDFWTAKNKRPKNQTVISHYFVSSSCAVCQKKSCLNNNSICPECRESPQKSSLTIVKNMKKIETKFFDALKICKACNGSRGTEQDCSNTECPNLFRYSQARINIQQVDFHLDLLKKFQDLQF